MIRPAHASLAAIEEETYLATRSDLDLRHDLTCAIQSLPDIYRDVIILRDLEELTIREIAVRRKPRPRNSQDAALSRAATCARTSASIREHLCLQALR